ncbi:hypothetical protein AC519_4667 [Pseudomonas savastanoi]|nr:hypothetical protein AC519_4667 [Pseudomonas savastanoi]
MLPVKTDLISIKEALVTGDHRFVGNDHDSRRVQTAADPLTHTLARHRITIARHADQAGARDTDGAFHVAIKGRRHRHHFSLLQLQDFCHRQTVVLRMYKFSPERTTALAEPDVQLLEGMEHAILSIEPDSPPAVLHVLFDDAFLPARGHVAEVRIEQIVRAHHGKPGIDRAAFAFVNLVDSRFHVVVDAATWHATQRSKRTCMGIKQHLVALTGVRNQPERATCAQLHMGDLDTSKQATDQQAFFAPVKLKGLTEGKSQRYKSAYRLALLAPPRADKRRELAVTAVITLGLDLLKKCLGAPTVVFWPERISLERLL